MEKALADEARKKSEETAANFMTEVMLIDDI
jgi:hypothetical protein